MSRSKLTESKLLEGATRGLGPEEPDEHGLGSNPAAVDKEILPADGLSSFLLLACNG